LEVSLYCRHSHIRDFGDFGDFHIVDKTHDKNAPLPGGKTFENLMHNRDPLLGEHLFFRRAFTCREIFRYVGNGYA
jgi:hypothetical protein